MSWLMGVFLLLTIFGAAVLGWFFHAYIAEESSDPREAARTGTDNG